MIRKARIWRDEVVETIVSGSAYRVTLRPTGLYLWHYRDEKYWVDAFTFDLLLQGVREILGT